MRHHDSGSLKKRMENTFFEPDLRGSRGSRTARVWYSENKIADFSSNFEINPIQFLFSDVCDMRHHDSGSLKKRMENTFFEPDLRGSRGSRTARVWYSKNKIADFSSNFEINPIKCLFSDVCDLRHHISGSLKKRMINTFSEPNFPGFPCSTPFRSCISRIKSPISRRSSK